MNDGIPLDEGAAGLAGAAGFGGAAGFVGAGAGVGAAAVDAGGGGGGGAAVSVAGAAGVGAAAAAAGFSALPAGAAPSSICANSSPTVTVSSGLKVSFVIVPETGALTSISILSVSIVASNSSCLMNSPTCLVYSFREPSVNDSAIGGTGTEVDAQRRDRIEGLHVLKEGDLADFLVRALTTGLLYLSAAVATVLRVLTEDCLRTAETVLCEAVDNMIVCFIYRSNTYFFFYYWDCFIRLLNENRREQKFTTVLWITCFCENFFGND